MKKAILIIFGLCGAIGAVAQESAKIEKEIGKIIYHDTEITFDKTPGYLIGVRFQDSVFVYGYGNSSKQNGQTPTKDDIFEIGALTKSFTALVTGRLAATQLIHPDSNINIYLPAAFQNHQLQITPNDLMRHTSGLPRIPERFGEKEKDSNNPFGHYTKTDLLEYYTSFIPNDDHDRTYRYSHVNYALLEIILELVTGKNFESLLRHYVFQPLEMTQTGIHDFTVDNRNHIVQGYSLGGNPVAPWKMQSFAGSEGIKSSMNDLMKYLDYCMQTDTASIDSILAFNQQPLVQTNISKNTFSGNGWHVITYKNYYDIILHAGSTTGYRAFLGYVKETKTGVVILANSPANMNGLGLLILRMLNHGWKKR